MIRKMRAHGWLVPVIALVACEPVHGERRNRSPDPDRSPIATPSPSPDASDRIPAFTAAALAGGAPVTFDSQATKRPTVYAFLGTHCPTTTQYLERIRAIEAAYRPRGVDFVYVYPNRTDTSDGKLAHYQAERFGGTFIDDEGARIAQLVGARRTAEVLVTDARGHIFYRGAVDDNREVAQVKQPFLATALDEHLAGKKVTTPRTEGHA